MTQRSKCEICRARKIKCDETRPSCGHCAKKGRKCFYKSDGDPVFVHEQVGELQIPAQSQSSSVTTSRSSSYRSDRTEANVDRGQFGKDVTLRLKRSRKAETGSGEFLMFGRPRRRPSKIKLDAPSEADDGELPDTLRRRSTASPSPTSILSRPQDSLAARWMSVAGEASLNLYPLGKWVKLAWDHVGCNGYLDLAVEYALSAMTAFRQQNGNDFIKISTIGGRAMRSLRQAIMSGAKSIDVYVAIMLHYATEHFRGMQTCYWISHMSAVSQLLASKIPDTDEHETVHSIIHATREDEVVESILNGQLSLLENLNTPTTVLGSLELDLALSELDRLLVKLPRLVLLVRAAKQDPKISNQPNTATESIALAQELYKSEGTLIIQRSLTNVMERTTLAPTTLTSLPVSSSYYFGSIPDFVLATRYFLLRLLLSGLMQSICDLDYESIPFDRAAVEEEDIWAGTSIFQCVEWAFKPEHGVQLTMLRMLIPLQLGFGAWDRLLKRQTSSDTPDYQHAIRMRDASIEIANQIDVAWSNKLTVPERLHGICEMFAGGPLGEWMYNYRSVSGGAMT